MPDKKTPTTAKQSAGATKSKVVAIKKPAQTLRQKSATLSTPKKDKTRHLKAAGSTARRPITGLLRIIKAILRPFSFFLWPFRTRPARFIGRMLANILLLKYFRNSWKELRQVSWPDRKETTRLTLAVITFALFFGTMIAVTDYGLDKVFKFLFIK